MDLFSIERKMSFYSLLWLTLIFSQTEECCGTITVMETGSSGCISFSYKTESFSYIVRNEMTSLCFAFRETVKTIPLAWNRSFTCTYSNSTINVCISDLRFSDAGLFSLKELSILVQNVTLEVRGKRYNLTGSSELAVLGEAFNWTCGMYTPPGNNITGVVFRRNSIIVVGIGFIGSNCITQISTTRYNYQCSSESRYILTIPSQNMTEYEQGSVWRCEYVVQANFYRSPDVVLNIAIDVDNVSIIPTENPLTIREGAKREVRCVVNSNAVPAPIINWFLGSTNITDTADTHTTSITITGNRTDNTKRIECRATNNNKFPKTAFTLLNVEYPPYVKSLSIQKIKEGSYLSVICQARLGNPGSTTFYWTKVDNPGFRRNGSTLQLYNIQRSSSGTYRCTAENIFSNGEKGTHSQTMVVNVLYPPTINTLSHPHIIEGRDLSVLCQATHGNPNSTTFYWTKVDDSGFRQNGSTLLLPNIQRTSSGTYRCTAENNYSNGEKGTDRQSMVVDVQFPPRVISMSQQDVIEGRNLSVTCQATPGNPNSTTFVWTTINNPAFRQNGKTLRLFNIQRNSSGSYMCSGENIYTNGERGIQSQTTIVNVLYHPTIENKPRQIINQTETVTLTRHISSNPMSNVSWYDKSKLLKTQESASIASLIIKNATCTDTKNLTLVVSNGLGDTATTVVELIVNCKPVPIPTNITLGITFASVIDFSTTVIAYPEPQYELVYEIGTKNNQWKHNLIRKTLNNFTIHFSQTVFALSIIGLHQLLIKNAFGEATVLINVFKQRKPDNPRGIEVMCELSRARVQWISSFNGGDPQNFTVVILNGLDGKSLSYRFYDQGENKIHVTYVGNLQPSVTYWFYVSGENSHGSSTTEVTSCKTDTTISQTSVVILSVVGALVLVTIVLLLVFFAHKRYACIIACEKRNRNIKVETKRKASNDTTLEEKQELPQRDCYDELIPNENANQYETIMQKDIHGNNEKLYEKLQKRIEMEEFFDKQNIQLKIKDSNDEKLVTPNADEYENTSFMK